MGQGFNQADRRKMRGLALIRPGVQQGYAPQSRSLQAGLLWLPSHSGSPCVALQVQKKTRLLSGAVQASGVKPVGWWLPSQNGCLADRPQVHQK
jgi:hypothetical protein